ncbi:MAG: signal peptide peptidase SppA [Sphingomonadales bacterium]|nr:signal peptide peptidase SppA [Sphingomonadales bacterium]
MAFAQKVWRLLVAIKDGLVLLLLLLFFGLIHAALTARGNPASVRDGALLIALNGAVVEEPARADPLSLLLSGEVPTREYAERDLLRALRAAVLDQRIKAVALDMSRFTGAGLVHAQEIGAALDAVRAAHKPVLAYARMLGNNGALIAAHADEVWLDPLGGVIVSGPGGNQLFYGQLLEKLKVNVHVFRVGTFKDAVEPYIRNDMSAPSRAARKQLYGAVWKEWQADVTRARPKARLAQVLADPVGWIKASDGDAARAALAAGLVDHLGTRAEFGARMVRLVGADSTDSRPGAFAHTALTPFLAAHPITRKGKTIAVATIAGEIVDGTAGPGTAGGDRIAKLIDGIDKDDVAALVVRVDSPGGSVTASEAIRAAILRQKARGIPVVVSMANVAASGGYWVSTPGARIFARPTTITGSIGIFAVIPSFEKALSAWGVTGDGVRTTPLSGQPDPFSGLTPEVEQLLQANVDSGYARFIGLVAQSRHKTPQQVDAIGQGRVWDGGAALDNGLVDQPGGLDDALAWAAAKAHLGKGEWHASYLGEPASPLGRLQNLLPSDDDADTADDSAASPRDVTALVAIRQQAVLARAFADITRMMAGEGAQARCLDCATDAGTAAPPAVSLRRLLATLRI